MANDDASSLALQFQPTHDYQVAVMVIVSIWAMLGVTTTFLSLRLYCRAFRGRQMWWDDYLLAGGWGFLLLSTALQTRLFMTGYTTTVLAESRILVYNYVSDNAQILALGLTKTSFALTLQRFIFGWPRYFIIGLTTVMNAIFVIRCVLDWKAICGDSDWFNIQPCWSPSSALQFNAAVTAISALTDFILAGIPIKIIATLQMAKREKVGAAIALSIGMLAGIIAILKAVKAFEVSTDTSNFAHDIAILSIWIVAEPNAAIIATSIPVLRVFLRDSRHHAGYSGSRVRHGAGSNRRSRIHTRAGPGTASGEDRGGPYLDNCSEMEMLSDIGDREGAKFSKEGVAQHSDIELEEMGE
ncbi:hypothetical protein BX600DRAFT_548509 [Xylariales sp. PMI_506]|nr:hypothetical protein BX600DRAFT_548509 [Xylariales sp. PMI_506]